jgi:hypothetical protein
MSKRLLRRRPVTEFPDIYPAKESPQWATFCPTRSPEFKAHTKKGLAHSAIAYHKPHAEIALYRLEVVQVGNNLTVTGGGNDYIIPSSNTTTGAVALRTQWKKVWEYTIPEKCDFCEKEIGRAWGRPDVSLPYHYKGRVIDAPVVCRDCYHAGRTEAISEQKRREDIKRLKALRELYPDV